MRLRPGKGSPASVASGIARAAASETPPRIPDHVISASADAAGIGSRSRSLLTSSRGSFAAG